MTRKARAQAAPEEPLSFERALSRLEQIVKELEEGEQGLEDSIRLYEEGRRLVKLSTAKLDEAQARIEELVRAEGGWETQSVDAGEVEGEDAEEDGDDDAR
ncbi:MAG: exodeoxyribonuclease VII small subunit [Candidatus Eisenbacteria bacterium]|nr:exodeoxyribonuclease VII small subunit [Candidatus Eisenbacteria bacterium]